MIKTTIVVKCFLCGKDAVVEYSNESTYSPEAMCLMCRNIHKNIRDKIEKTVLDDHYLKLYWPNADQISFLDHILFEVYNATKKT